MRRTILFLAVVSLVLSPVIAPSAGAATARMSTTGQEVLVDVPDPGVAWVSDGIDHVRGWTGRYTTMDSLYGAGTNTVVANWNLDLATGDGTMFGTADIYFASLGGGFEGTWTATFHAFSWSGPFVAKGYGQLAGLQERLRLQSAEGGDAYSGFVFRPGSTGLPVLLTPIRDASITQNDPATGCILDPTRGYGFKILFDWTDSPFGLTRYELFVEHEGASFPLVDTVVSGSQFDLVSCNAYVADANLEGWRWRVRSIDALGQPGAWTGFAYFRFEPCLLDGGTPCGSTQELERSERVTARGPFASASFQGTRRSVPSPRS